MTRFGFCVVLYKDVRILLISYNMISTYRYQDVIKIKSKFSITDQLGYVCKIMYLKSHKLNFEKYRNNFELRVLIFNGVDVVHRIDRRSALRKLLLARLSVFLIYQALIIVPYSSAGGAFESIVSSRISSLFSVVIKIK